MRRNKKIKNKFKNFNQTKKKTLNNKITSIKLNNLTKNYNNKSQSQQLNQQQKHQVIQQNYFKKIKQPTELFDANKQCKIAFDMHYGLCRVHKKLYLKYL